MSAEPAGLSPEITLEATALLEIAGVCLLVGWAAQRLLDPGIHVRGISLLTGLFGLYGGAWMWRLAGWEGGLAIGGYAVLPTLVGALAAATALKVITLVLDGSKAD
jgi:hypothetical protein